MGGRSGKFGVAVLKASASRSVKFGVVVFRVCMLDWWWGDLGKFGVVVLKASMLDLGG